jgi:hypothetical protein
VTRAGHEREESLEQNINDIGHRQGFQFVSRLLQFAVKVGFDSKDQASSVGLRATALTR